MLPDGSGHVVGIFHELKCAQLVFRRRPERLAVTNTIDEMLDREIEAFLPHLRFVEDVLFLLGAKEFHDRIVEKHAATGAGNLNPVSSTDVISGRAQNALNHGGDTLLVFHEDRRDVLADEGV